MTFASKLSRLLEARKLSQKGLADLIGSNQTQVSRWVNGESIPDLAVGYAIALELTVPLHFLADDSQEEPPSLSDGVCLRSPTRLVIDATISLMGEEQALKRLLQL